MHMTQKIGMWLSIDTLKIMIFSKNNNTSIAKSIDNLVTNLSEKCN